MNEYEMQKARESATLTMFGTLLLGGAKLILDSFAEQELNNLEWERRNKQERYNELKNKKWGWLFRSQEEIDEMNSLSKEIKELDAKIAKKRK